MVHTSNITLLNANTTLDLENDVYVFDASSGNITITLPLITCDGIQYKIKRLDNTPTNTITLQGTGGQLLDGGLTFILKPLTCCEVNSYNSEWYIISNSEIITGIKTYYNGYRNINTSITLGGSVDGTIIPFATTRISNSEVNNWIIGGGGTTFTIPSQGIYSISYTIYVNNASTAGRTISLCLTLNSTTPSTSGIIPGLGSTVTITANHRNIVYGFGIVSLNAGDIIRAYARRSGGGVSILNATSLYTNDNTQTTISFTKIV
jgi:hypothetical protein